MIFFNLQQFAADSGPVVHIKPLIITTVAGYPITNSMLYAWLSSAVIIAILVAVARKITMRPKAGITQVIEAGTDFVSGMLETSLGSREKADKYTPYFATIFFFIAFSNLMGLLPGVGEALVHNGEPLFRPFTADLNGTLAAATVSLVLVQYFAIRESGAIKHLRHYFAGKLWNPLTYLVGIYEVFGDFIRLSSLALRLFLNIAIGEIIISVFSYLGKFAAPLTSLPFLFLELGVCLLQAYIFVMLSVTYLSLAIAHGDDNVDASHQQHSNIAELEVAKA